MEKERFPIDITLNDNAKTAVVAIATAIVALAFMNIIRIIFRRVSDDE